MGWWCLLFPIFFFDFSVSLCYVSRMGKMGLSQSMICTIHQQLWFRHIFLPFLSRLVDNLCNLDNGTRDGLQEWMALTFGGFADKVLWENVVRWSLRDASRRYQRIIIIISEISEDTLSDRSILGKIPQNMASAKLKLIFICFSIWNRSSFPSLPRMSRSKHRNSHKTTF